MVASTKELMSTARPSDNIIYGAEANVIRLRIGAEETEPFFGDNEGGEDIAIFRSKCFAKVHHRVDVAVAEIRHGHHVALHGWFSFDETHSSETLTEDS